MGDCVNCGMPTPEESLNASRVCLTCRAQELVEEARYVDGRSNESIDIDAIIGANRPTCPTCDSNDKATRWNVTDGVAGVRQCSDIWHTAGRST